MNAVEYLQQHNKAENPLRFAIEDAALGHAIAHMPGYTREIAAIKITMTTKATLPPSKPIYPIALRSENHWLPQDETAYILLENALIVDAHYGCIAENTRHTQVYVLPVQLREVRGKVMELIQTPTAVDPEEVRHPLAIKLEQTLFKTIQGQPHIELSLVHKALAMIKKYHGGVKRKSGEPFFTHPLAVALIVCEYSLDQAAILGALLHDTVEDTSLSLAHIQLAFGADVAFIVAKATNLEDHQKRINLSDAENLTRILNYEDPRAALVKLADRLHNMRTIQFHPSLAKQQYIAEETLKFFVPLAKKIHRETMAEELKNLSAKVLAPKI